MWYDVYRFVLNCTTCERNRAGPQAPRGSGYMPVRPTEPPSGPCLDTPSAYMARISVEATKPNDRLRSVVDTPRSLATGSTDHLLPDPDDYLVPPALARPTKWTDIGSLSTSFKRAAMVPRWKEPALHDPHASPLVPKHYRAYPGHVHTAGV